MMAKPEGESETAVPPGPAIRRCRDDEVAAIGAVINDAAEAYRGIIPADRWHHPYMPEDELRREIEAGVVFSCAERDGVVAGVMGFQDVGDVILIRHAYVRTIDQRAGLGGALLEALSAAAAKPLLIGTWAAATWAVDFYQRHGFRMVSTADKDRLLRTYWTVPERQMETSVVLADAAWWRGAAP